MFVAETEVIFGANFALADFWFGKNAPAQQYKFKTVVHIHDIPHKFYC